jgi:hypothetical protein
MEKYLRVHEMEILQEHMRKNILKYVYILKYFNLDHGLQIHPDRIRDSIDH